VQPNIVPGETVLMETPVLDGGRVLERSVVLERPTSEVDESVPFVHVDVAERQSVDAET